MRRNIHYKPSKGASIFGGIIGCAMGIFGLFAIPDMGAMIGFKAIWCLRHGHLQFPARGGRCEVQRRL